MQVVERALNGLILIRPRVFTDNRGIFFESFNQQLFNEIVGEKVEFVQDNHSVSHLNVIRGLHLQAPPYAQGKLVRVVRGKVYDVAVDVRKGSPTYGQHYGVELSAENNFMFWVPPGFLHGFSVLEDNTVFLYKCSGVYNKEAERTVLYNDPLLNIDWKVKNGIVSEKDVTGDLIADFKTPFDYI